MPTILMLGAGRLGGALLSGWGAIGPVSMSDVLIRDPRPGPEALRAVEAGARLDPDDRALSTASIVLLAVKPQVWRGVVEAVEPHLAPGAVIVSVVAGVAAADLERAFGGRAVARVMPTIAVAAGQGTATIYAATAKARDRAHDLFDNLATTVDIEDEALMHAATAVSGSGPAYLYAFIEALEAAAVRNGLPADAAALLAESTVLGAASLLSMSDATPGELREQVTSPGGTTAAGLEVLTGGGALQDLLAETVGAAARRSRELG
ncbi:MAG: pyrroline-5-carboxylate reductase [Pseudomonadota bacterium]